MLQSESESNAALKKAKEDVEELEEEADEARKVRYKIYPTIANARTFWEQRNRYRSNGEDRNYTVLNLICYEYDAGDFEIGA
jgi:hypothetical protein